MKPIRKLLNHLKYTGVIGALLLTGMMAVMAAIYSAIDPRLDQGLDWVQSFYFMYETLTSIGYGDYTPLTPGSKAFISVAIMFGLPAYSIVSIYAAQVLIHEVCLKPWVNFLNFFFPCCRGTRFTSRKSKWSEGMMVIVFAFSVSLFFSGIFCILEGWSFGISVYFIIVSIATVGYGDYVPTTEVSQGIWIIFACLGLSLHALGIGYITGAITNYLAEKRASLKEKKRLRKERKSSHDLPSGPPARDDIDVDATGRPSSSSPPSASLDISSASAPSPLHSPSMTADPI